MSTPGSSASDPTSGPAEELRWRLGALVSKYGALLASDPDAWRACELELSALYSGSYAVRAYAVVQALKGGLVADLVTWRRDGARGIDAEIAQRLTERSGVSRPIAEWAVAAWVFAFGLEGPIATAAPPPPVQEPLVKVAAAPLSAAASIQSVQRPAEIVAQPTTDPVVAATPGRELVVGIPHLVTAGVGVALVVSIVLGQFGGLPAALGMADKAAAATPLPPPPELETVPRRSKGVTAPIETGSAQKDQAPTCANGAPADAAGPRSRRARASGSATFPFPDALRDEGIDRGTVVVRFTVDANGRAQHDGAEIVRATHPALEALALDAIEELRYLPARRDGCPIASTVTRALNFGTTGSEPIR